jgi:hypothetical protein
MSWFPSMERPALPYVPQVRPRETGGHVQWDMDVTFLKGDLTPIRIRTREPYKMVDEL